ncbi:hypothetical protein D9M69_499120 [compost metagenome]
MRGDVFVFPAAVKPREAAGSCLLAAEFIKSRPDIILHFVQIEQYGDTLHLLFFAHGITHPGGFFQQDILQLFIYFQFGSELALPVPVVKHRPDFRLGGNDVF